MFKYISRDGLAPLVFPSALSAQHRGSLQLFFWVAYQA